jgi:RNA polymerase sigma-70 factor (family 1)
MQDATHNDRILFQLISEGDEAAFRQLFHTYAPQLQPMVLRITKTAAVTEDILQEAFLRLWISRDKLTAIQNPRSWILRIVFHLSFSYLRRQAVHDKAMDKLSDTQPEWDAAVTPEQTLAYNALIQLIGEAVEQLPPKAKHIYMLSREGGLKIPEIAAELGLSPSTVKNSLVRSLQAIRRHIEAGGHFLPFLILWLLKC